jgi:hypothetical protein
MEIIKKFSQMRDEVGLEEFVRLCNKIVRCNGQEYFKPNRELALGLVCRTGDLCEAGELDEDELEHAAACASDLSGIPMDLLLIGWAHQVAGRMKGESVRTSEEDDYEDL